MNATKALNDVLDINPNIKFNEAVALLLTKYEVNLSRSNYDKIKSVRKKGKKKTPGKKDSKKTKSNKKPDTLTRGVGPAQPPPLPELTKEMLKGLGIKKKLLMLGEAALDEYLLTGAVSKILTKAVDLLSKEEFLDQGTIADGVYWTSDTPPYERPKFLYDHQKVAMKLMDLGHLLWQASRQLAGKTTAGLAKDFEDMLEEPNYTVALVAPTVPLAVEVLYKWLYTPIKFEGKIYTFYNLIKPYLLKRPNQNGFMLKNNSRLMIISLNQAGAQGRTINKIHITELDKLGTEQSKRIALAGVINSLRANKDAKVLIDCNMPTGIFRLLKQELYKFGRYFPIFDEDPFDENDYHGRHTIINEDVIVRNKPTLDDILKIFSEILVSYAFAEGQFYNIDDVSDECFNPSKTEIAYKKEHNPQDYFVKTVAGIDPGGKVDAFGITFWSLTKDGQVVERWAKRFFNAKHTAKEQAKEISKNLLLFNVERIQSESSAGAPWSISLIEHYVNKYSQGKIRIPYDYINFGAKKTPLAKDNFVYLFKIILDYEMLILHERDKEERALHHQIVKYIPNKSESNNNPDDLVESGFHGVWCLLGGWDYLDKLIEKQHSPIVETAR